MKTKFLLQKICSVDGGTPYIEYYKIFDTYNDAVQRAADDSMIVLADCREDAKESGGKEPKFIVRTNQHEWDNPVYSVECEYYRECWFVTTIRLDRKFRHGGAI